MVRGVGALVDHGPGARRIGALGVRGGDHDPGRPHLALDVAVLVEAPVDQVLVVGHGGVDGHHHPALPPHLGPTVDRVDVLPQHGVVFLVQADGVLDVERLAQAVGESGIHITDLAQAVAAQLERGGHVAQPPLADVVGGAPVVVEAGVPVRHDHLGEGHPVGDVPFGAVVVVADLMDHRALAVVEGEPETPVLPTDHVAVDLERRAVGLGDVQRLDVVAQGLAGHQVRLVLPHHRRRSARPARGRCPAVPWCSCRR